MLKHYFEFKIKRQEFIENVNSIISELEGKKILICGNHKGFSELDKCFKLSSRLNITGYCLFNEKTCEKKRNAKNYTFRELNNADFEYILITGTKSDNIITRLMNEVDEDKLKYKVLFDEELRDTAINLEFLLKNNFDKTLPKLIKKLEGKKVLFYGGGLLFQLIKEYYDLSKINAIGIVDKKLSKLSTLEELCGYKLYSPDDIKELNPDYVIIATRRVIGIFEELYFDYLKDTKIKIIPLIKRSLWSLIRER